MKESSFRLCARKTVILRNYYFTASVEQDWETNEHTAFSFGWMPLFVFGAKSLIFCLVWQG